MPRISNRVMALAFLLLSGGLAWGEEASSPAPSSSDCMGCHGDRDLFGQTPRGRSLRLWVDEPSLKKSVHADLECADCHGGQKTWEEAPHNQGQALTDRCAECHETAAREYGAGIHAQARQEGSSPKAPACRDCHGGHDILPIASPESRVSRIRQPQTCGRCHANDDLAPGDGIAKRRLIERYYESVHWKALQEGKAAASCSDCHGAHEVRPSSEAASTVSPIGLVNTCERCHQEQARVFREGSHGHALLHGNLDVPTCITCHGDHETTSLRARSGGKRDFAGTEVCIWCHGNARMMARYALDTSPVESYLKDIHGLTQRGTSGASATCADCHDAHHSLPASHPESRMHITNRGTVCGKCHGKSADSFIMSFTHRAMSVPHGGSVKQVITWVYLVLIVMVIGGMLLHNLLIWSHAVRRKLRRQRQGAFIVRLNRFERWWHWSLLLSFSTLAVTGFALKYSESALFRWMFSLGMTEGMRAAIHRVAAVVLVAGLLAFFAYQCFFRAGRRWLTGMLPRWSDVTDLWANVRYHLGLVSDPPRFGMFSYVEKLEYWALLWGTVIMLVTGLVLMFAEVLPQEWPEWLIDASRLIHFFEAVLATLAILVWHLFSTMFHYAEYPMDTSWLTGSLDEEEARRRFTDVAIQEHQRVTRERPATARSTSAPHAAPAKEAPAGGENQKSTAGSVGDGKRDAPENQSGQQSTAPAGDGDPSAPKDQPSSGDGAKPQK